MLLSVEMASCGSNSGTGPGHPADGAPDQTADVASNDVVVTNEAGKDVLATDSAADGGAEGSLGDGEAGACAVTVPPQSSFVAIAAAAACQRLQQCCLLSGPQFDSALCISTFSTPSFGGWQGSAYAEPYLDGGNIGYDEASACQCLEQTANLNCGLVSATTLQALETACIGALLGKSVVDGGCSSSFECAPLGTYCADSHSCQPLIGDGGACTRQDQCSYGGIGTLAGPSNALLYCNASHACGPRLFDDAGCTNNDQCNSDTCLNVGTSDVCESSGIFSDPGTPGGTCDYFTIKDASAD
jgi:hypothetical protein